MSSEPSSRDQETSTIDRPLDQYASMLPLEVCSDLQTKPQGLSDSEAHARLRRYGLNTITAQKAAGVGRLIGPFANWITLLLFIAGALAFVSASAPLGWAIIIVAVLNGLFTLWQEYMAERAISALQHLLPSTTYVRRDGQVKKVPTAEIVPGDVLPLRPNTIVAADGYLIAGDGIRVRQTMLTGNNAPVTKVPGPLSDRTLAPHERPNQLLAGTSVIEGQGSLVVVGTGMHTQLGDIAESTAALHPGQSSLGRALNRLVGTVSKVAIAAGVAAFLLTFFGQRLDWQNATIFAIGMIVAFVPEGLLPTVTLALALARRRLQRHHVLVKQLAGVESLGSATVLCLDQVSTLAVDKLTVSAAWAGGQHYQVSGTDYTPEGSFLRNSALVAAQDEQDLFMLLRAVALCNNARLLPPDAQTPTWHILGDPIEGALLVAAAKSGIDTSALAANFTRLHSFPYDPRRQMTSVVVATTGEGGRDPIAYVRGIDATVLPLCTHMMREGHPTPLDEDLRKQIAAQLDTYARQGMRVLAFAERHLLPGTDGTTWRTHEIEHDLTLLGLVGLQQPPQPETSQLIEGCRQAGLRVILTTGAYGLTAEANARRVGIITAGSARIVSGAELDEISDEQLAQLLSNADSVFAQLSAEQKRRIVVSLQSRGEVVAFLGDSINDAPALKQADIGVAVSSSGTTVALAAADIVLHGDHPAGLLLAIEESRAIFSNIQKFSTYIFTHNVAETVAVVASVILGIPLPLHVLQVLAIDLGTELFPSIALSTEPPEPGSLERPPRSRNEPLIDHSVLIRSFGWLGVLEGGLALFAYLLPYWGHGWRLGQPFPDTGIVYAQATTLAYAGIVLAQVGNAIASRTRKIPVWEIGIFTNRPLLIGILASVALMLALIYIQPLAGIFGFVPPSLQQWAILLPFPLIMLAAEEGRKWWSRRGEYHDPAV